MRSITNNSVAPANTSSDDHATSSSLKLTLSKFTKWLQANGYASYDPYNLWSSDYGVYAKGLFHRIPLLGAFAVAPIFLADILIPRLARRTTTKRRFAIADAHCILAYCERARTENNEMYLKEAEELAQALLSQSLGEHYSGHCWGYPFDWMSKNGLWKSSTPLVTTTPYCFEAFLALYDLTQKSEYNHIAQSIATFCKNDIPEQVRGEHSRAAAYSPIDSSMVINANAYRAMVLCEAAGRYGSRSMLESALHNLNFVLESQRPDGSWWYAEGNESDRFIDNFHTCLVLKNLVKINHRLGFAEVWDAIERGYEYYLRNLIDDAGEPKPFARQKRIPLVSREIYDFAEGISLGLLINKNFPGIRDHSQLRSRALACAERLSDILITKYQCNDGHFVSKVHFSIIRNTLPYIRWAQAQCFYALSLLATHRHNANHASWRYMEPPFLAEYSKEAVGEL